MPLTDIGRGGGSGADELGEGLEFVLVGLGVALEEEGRVGPRQDRRSAVALDCKSHILDRLFTQHNLPVSLP